MIVKERTNKQEEGLSERRGAVGIHVNQSSIGYRGPSRQGKGGIREPCVGLAWLGWTLERAGGEGG